MKRTFEFIENSDGINELWIANEKLRREYLKFVLESPLVDHRECLQQLSAFVALFWFNFFSFVYHTMILKETNNNHKVQ